MLTLCGDKIKSNDDSSNDATAPSEESAINITDAITYYPNRGIGKHTSIDFGVKLDEAMASIGEKIQSVKYSYCYKLIDKKISWPTLEGVYCKTENRMDYELHY